MTHVTVYAPYDQSEIASLPLMDKAGVLNAIKTAHDLFTNRDAWLPAHERVAILEKVVTIMEDRIEGLTRIAAREGGKPYVDSKVEVMRAINGVKLAIEHVGQLKGEQIPMGHTPSSVNRLAYTLREPIGVCASISAFNHPLNLTIHQTVPAIAVGTPVIIKPAMTTPMSCMAFVDILYEAGLPKAWCQAVLAENEDAEALISDERVNYVSFIGSAKVGWMLRSKLGPGTHIALEHGGAAPVIVEKDADLEGMIPSLTKGGFYHAGQVCVSVQRVFVESSMCDTVANAIAEQAKTLIVGDPLDPKTEVGPLILPREVDRVETWVNEAVKAGATLLCGGKRISATCYEPTVLLNPPEDTKVMTQEIFGPVVCVTPYADRLDAIKRANSLPFAFQAAVWTKDLDVALDTMQRLNAAAVMVNDHTAFRVDWMPFGGRDASGMGVGGIPYTMHEMTREKLMVIKSAVL